MMAGESAGMGYGAGVVCQRRNDVGVTGEHDETGHAFLPGIQQIQYFLPRALHTAWLDISG